MSSIVRQRPSLLRHSRRTKTLLVYARELFVVDYEYGHIMFGHLTRAREAGGGELRLTKQEEFDADQGGVSLMFPIIGSDPRWALVGPEALFGCLDCAERGVAVLSLGLDADLSGKGSGSHPDSDSRRPRLRKVIRAFLGEDSGASIATADQMRITIEVLWDRAQTHFTQLHQQGVKASTMRI